MIVKNPTKNDIEVQIEGIRYFVKAEGQIIGVPTPHAEYWKNNLHNFLKISKESSVKTQEEDTTEKEEVKEEEEIIEVTTTSEETEDEVDSTEDDSTEEEDSDSVVE